MFNEAKWIWHNDYQKVNIYLNFFESITLDKLCGEYKFYISADSNYAIYINGSYVNGSQYADYPMYKVYDEIDVSAFLKVDKNDIVVVGYCQNTDSSTYRKEYGAIIYEILCGDKVLLSSSENTEVALNSAYKSEGVNYISGQLGFTFEYDSRKADEKVGLKKADVLEKSMTLYPRPVKPLEIFDRESGKIVAQGMFNEQTKKVDGIGGCMQYSSMTFRDISISKSLPNENGGEIVKEDGYDGVYLVIDFAKENTGILELDIELPCDAEILVGYGEHLDDLRVRSWVGTRNFCASFYGKKGRNTFMNPFRRFGLRYMQLHIYAPNFKLYYAGFRPTLYPISTIPSFKCADHLHNKIFEVSVRTLWMCMHEHYEDCPWREQALYAMDSRNQMLCGYYALGEYDFAKASIRQMALSIREDNMLELCAPARCSITIPSFCAILPIQFYEYILYSGDFAFIDEILPTVKCITDEFIRRIDTNGLIKCFLETKYWNFYEWQQGLEGSISGSVSKEAATYDAPLNAFFIMSLNSMSKLYALLKDEKNAEYYNNISLKLSETINKAFWNEDKQLYATYLNMRGSLEHYCELTQALIACANVAPKARLDIILEALASKQLLPTTISYSIFKYEALMKNQDKYARFVFDDIAEVWSEMLYNKATTFWETIKGADDFGNGGSLCHGWSATPIYFYYAYAAGMKIKQDGSGEYEKTTPVGGIYDCKVIIETPKGIIKG